MSKQSVFTCDKCGKAFTYKNIQFSGDSEEIKKIEIKFGDYNKKEFDLCIDCCKELGFVTKETKVNSIDEIDNFLDSLASLVAERIE